MYDQETLLNHFSNPRFELSKCDVRDARALDGLLNDADYVIHLASIVGSFPCNEQTELAKEVNYQGTRNVVDAAPDDCGFVLASTGSVYGQVDGICDETTAVDPLSVYAETKLKAEEYVQQHTEHVTYRPATAFGLSDRPVWSSSRTSS